MARKRLLTALRIKEDEVRGASRAPRRCRRGFAIAASDRAKLDAHNLGRERILGFSRSGVFFLRCMARCSVPGH